MLRIVAAAFAVTYTLVVGLSVLAPEANAQQIAQVQKKKKQNPYTQGGKLKKPLKQ